MGWAGCIPVFRFVKTIIGVGELKRICRWFFGVGVGGGVSTFLCLCKSRVRKGFEGRCHILEELLMVELKGVLVKKCNR